MKNQTQYRKQTELIQKLPLFFQPWWLDAVSKEWDTAIVEEKEQIAAIFVFQVEQKAGIKLLRNPPLSPYLGPLFLFEETTEQKQWKHEEQTLDKLFQQFPIWDYCQFTTPPGFQNFLHFSQKGFSNTNRLTYLLDLSQPEEIIFNNFQPRLRGYIRKAEQLLKIEQKVPEDLNQFLNWHKHSFSKKRSHYPFGLELFRTVISAAEQKHSSFFQIAQDKQNRPVAMLWTPFDQKTGYHLLAATDPNCTVNGALALLVWNAIKFLKQRNLFYYDFEGSMDKGIEQFFRKFGGKRVPYLLFEKNKSLIWRVKKELLG